MPQKGRKDRQDVHSVLREFIRALATMKRFKSWQIIANKVGSRQLHPSNRNTNIKKYSNWRGKWENGLSTDQPTPEQSNEHFGSVSHGHQDTRAHHCTSSHVARHRCCHLIPVSFPSLTFNVPRPLIVCPLSLPLNNAKPSKIHVASVATCLKQFYSKPPRGVQKTRTAWDSHK